MTADPLRVVLTGTPGTGKTTASDRLDVPVCHLNDAIRTHDLTEGTDTDRESLVADLDAVEDYVDQWIDDQFPDETDDADSEGDTNATDDTPPAVVIESHLAHTLPADRIVVFRCHPDRLDDRLTRRGESPDSIAENRESEALDVIAGEAVTRHGREAVYEIDTTDLSPPDAAAAVRDVIRGDREPAVGTVDFLDAIE